MISPSSAGGPADVIARAVSQGIAEVLGQQVVIDKYPGADHAFARHGGRTYSKPEADRALALSVDFFKQHLRS